MGSDRRYTQEEVDAILKRALHGQDSAKGDELSHQDLLETAREVGIEPAQIERAVTEVKRDQAKLALRDQWIADSKRRLSRGAQAWAFVNAICFVVYLMTAASYPWFVWVLVPWGIALFAQYLRLQRGPSPEELQRLQDRIDREERKRQLQANFQRGAEAIGAVVEEGANLLRSHLDERQKRLEAARRDGQAGSFGPKR